MTSAWSVGGLVGVLVVALGAVARGRACARPVGGSWQVPGGAFDRLERVRALAARAGREDGDAIHLLRFRTALERGGSVLQAFEAASVGSGRWPDGARRLVRRVRAGSGVEAAAARWAAEDPDPAVAVLVDALAISASTGGSHLRAVDAVIDAVRRRAALRREVRALASQARASAVVLMVMPVGFAVAVALLDARVRAFYVGSPAGLACVGVGVALDVVGAWAMARMIRRVA